MFKRTVGFIQTYVECKADRNSKKGKKLLAGKDWLSKFQYGLLTGMTDSDGHIHKHLGTEIKAVLPSTFQAFLNAMNNLGVTAKTKRQKAAENNYSKKDSYTICIPSRQIKIYPNKIPSVKSNASFE